MKEELAGRQILSTLYLIYFRGDQSSCVIFSSI
jgi:hypothetical protein